MSTTSLYLPPGLLDLPTVMEKETEARRLWFHINAFCCFMPWRRHRVFLQYQVFLKYDLFQGILMLSERKISRYIYVGLNTAANATFQQMMK